MRFVVDASVAVEFLLRTSRLVGVRLASDLEQRVCELRTLGERRQLERRRLGRRRRSDVQFRDDVAEYWIVLHCYISYPRHTVTDCNADLRGTLSVWLCVTLA